MLKQDFINKVKEGNKYEVRSILSIYLSRNRDDFKEALKYAKDNMNNLMEKYNNDSSKPFENNSENWNEAYFNEQKVYMMTNFCDERIEHLLKVSAKLFPENIFSKTSTTSSSTSYSSRSTSKNKTSRKKSDDDRGPKIAIGIGVVIAGVGLLTLKVSLIAVGAVVAVGGAVYKYNKDN